MSCAPSLAEVYARHRISSSVVIAHLAHLNSLETLQFLQLLLFNFDLICLLLFVLVVCINDHLNKLLIFILFIFSLFALLFHLDGERLPHFTLPLKCSLFLLLVKFYCFAILFQFLL